MVKMALWFYATLSSNFFPVVLGCFCSKGMQLFCLFPRRKVAYEVKVISLHQGGRWQSFRIPEIYQEKFGVSGYKHVGI